MSKQEELHLQLPKRYFDNDDLDLLDMAILSQIEEFERNGKNCYMKDETFAKNFKSSPTTINRAISRLAKDNYITKSTKTKNIDGKIQTIRHLSMNKVNKQNDNTINNSNIDFVSCQNDKLKDNYIKDNYIKDNYKKDNINDDTIEKDKNVDKDIAISKIETEYVVIKRKPRKNLLESLLNE